MSGQSVIQAAIAVVKEAWRFNPHLAQRLPAAAPVGRTDSPDARRRPWHCCADPAVATTIDGHAINIVKLNGKVWLVDAQTRVIANIDSNFAQNMLIHYNDNVAFLRTNR